MLIHVTITDAQTFTLIIAKLKQNSVTYFCVCVNFYLHCSDHKYLHHTIFHENLIIAYIYISGKK